MYKNALNWFLHIAKLTVNLAIISQIEDNIELKDVLSNHGTWLFQMNWSIQKMIRVIN